MLLESGFPAPTVIFDSSLDQLPFKSGALFVNDALTLRDALPGLTHYVVCIAGEHGYARHKTAQFLMSLGLLPLDVRHESALIDKTSQLGQGVQIMPRAVIHKFCEIGDDCIFNTGCTVDHECVIGNGVHVMGSAAITGRIHIGDFVTVGTNATILPDLTIGTGAFIGAGAVVTRDVSPYTLVTGCPANAVRMTTLRFDDSAFKLIGGAA